MPSQRRSGEASRRKRCSPLWIFVFSLVERMFSDCANELFTLFAVITSKGGLVTGWVDFMQIRINDKQRNDMLD